ncbi:MAG: ABC transporter ATP-binding protein/permease [Lachnospiraceae bacterium]|nr:ABC transporter ATP-binding protein/permease [Lachnospiraceae bacterium]
MKQILNILKKYKGESILAPLFKMLEATFELFVPLVISAIIDHGIGGNDRGLIFRYSGILLLLALIGLVCSITAQYFAARAAIGTATTLREKLFAHIQSFSYTEMDTQGTSTLITRMTSDINQVQNGINMTLRLFLRSPFIVFGAMIMAFTIDAKEAMIFVITIPVLSVIVFGIMQITRPLYKQAQGGLDSLLATARENLTGVRVIRAFCKEEEELEKFRGQNERLTFTQKKAGSISGLTNPFTYVVVNLAIVALLWTGAISVSHGSLTQGQVVALYNYMSQILVELIKLANLIVTITKALACAGRIQDVFQVSSSMEDGTGVPLPSDGDRTCVEFRDVSLTYKGAGAPSLEHISFKAYGGQTIGIIGGTGSGKSSVVNLIPRLYDATQGQVLYNGKPVETYTTESLRQEIAMVPQRAQLFKGTIRSNLLMANPEADETKLMEGLERAQALEFVKNKEGMLEAVVEQGGKNLSGGQKQRLTIARALMQDFKVLILDDSASALDYATDAKLRHALKNIPGEPLVFIVSQRSSSLRHADLILVMEDGRVESMGTHEELLQKSKVYQEIVASQNSGEEAAV